MIRFSFLVLIVLFIFNCDDSVSSGSPVINTEEWELTVPQTQNYADVTIKKHENQSITCTGNWYYDFLGNKITCKMLSGTVEKDTSYLIFTCSGKASYPPDSAGNVESSGFDMKMDGHFKDGASSGKWEISFSKEEWNGWVSDGVFTGQRGDGDGITN